MIKQKTAYEMYICDWSSDVCSSDLGKLVSVFWWVELDFFSLECNEVPSNEL